MTKVCSKCKAEQPATAYYADKRSPDGLKSQCRPCHIAGTKAVYRTQYEYYREYRLAWNRINRGKKNTYTASRRSKQHNATPKWLSKLQREQIAMFYESAARLSDELKTSVQVDHIIPLQSDLVCGLHVPWNLQVMLGVDNAAKSNKLEMRAA